ncbi:MAG: hypothetical protein AAFY71_10430 [Bacteroidota bacterium]
MKNQIFILLTLLPIFSVSQNKTYLGIEIGPKYEIYELEEQSRDISTPPFYYSPILGVTLGQDINSWLTVETGFFYNNYGESYRIRGDIGFGLSNAINAYQIPLRLKPKFRLFENRIVLSPTLGYTFAFNDEFGSDGNGGGFSSIGMSMPGFNDSTRYQDRSNYSLQRTYGLIETGFGVEFNFSPSVTVFSSFNYLRGIKRVVEIDITYKINDDPEETATVYSNGGYYAVAFGVRYAISDFWRD